MLEGLGKPVVFTGSQIPLAEVRTDARGNLITSMILAGSLQGGEVGIYLNGKLLRGNRAKKVSVGGLDAFESPNFPPLVTAGIDMEVRKDLLRSAPVEENVSVRSLPAGEVVAMRLFPGISAGVLARLPAEPVAGVVRETCGAGNAPVRDSGLLETLRRASERGVVIVNCTQCLRGAVDMSGYETGSALARAGVVSGGDMTVEAAIAKLSYLLSLRLPPEEARRLIAEDLRGELTIG